MGEALERALCKVVWVAASHGTRGSPHTPLILCCLANPDQGAVRALGSQGSNSSACHHGPQHLLQVSQDGSWRGKSMQQGNSQGGELTWKGLCPVKDLSFFPPVPRFFLPIHKHN